MAVGGASGAKSVAEFQEQLSRTILIDNLYPDVSEDVLLTAVNQFCIVENVTLFRHERDHKRKMSVALLQLNTQEKAETVVTEFREMLFMLGSLPRPVRATLASEVHFPDRPVPQRHIRAKLVKPRFKGWKDAKCLHTLACRKLAETAVLEKEHQKEEEKLAAEQLIEFQAEQQKWNHFKSFGGHPAHKRMCAALNFTPTS